jgi:putative transposase
MLRREGWAVNAKRIYRLNSEDGLAVRTKRRKRALGTRSPLALPDAINRRWSLDFVHR